MATTNLRQIMQEITKCRVPGEKSYRNYYPGESLDTVYEMLQGEKTVVFWREENSVVRVYFHTSCLRELAGILADTPEHSVIDFVCREGEVPSEAIEAGGFKKYAVFIKKQWAIKGIASVPQEGVAKLLYDAYQPDCGVYAGEEDVSQIHELLLQNFDPKADHIFSEEELSQMARDKEILVYKLGEKIESFFIYRREGKKLYCAFSYNNVSADILYSLERRVKEIEYKNGIAIHYAWFNAKNKKALRRNSGTDTGIRDYIFTK